MPKPKPVRVKHVVATLFAGACVTAAALPAMVGGAHVSVEPAPGRSASSGPPIVVVSKKVVVPRWSVPAAPVGRETTLNTTILDGNDGFIVLEDMVQKFLVDRFYKAHIEQTGIYTAFL